MRHVILGAGAIGGTIAARLVHAGTDVAVIARGEHGRSIADHGLTLRSPDDTIHVDVPVAARPDEIAWRADDVVHLAVKTQDTVAALHALAAAAPRTVSVVCAQNGVQNERMVLRRFRDVYAMCVMSPAAHLTPGEVLVYCAPVPAILDLGRYPDGVDDRAIAIAADLSNAGFLSDARPDVMRWKHRKLLLNLGNAVQALCGADPDDDELARIGRDARKEGHLAFSAAGIDVVSAEDDAARRADHLDLRPIEGHPYGGWSTWQSLERGTGRVEVDYLNGEIVLLGRLHGVATPVNEALQRLTNELARRGGTPGSVSVAEVRAMAGALTDRS